MLWVWLPPLGAAPLGLQERRRAVGRWPAHPGVARARLGDGGKSLGRKAPRTVIAAQLAGGLRRAILAHGAVDPLLISVKL